MQKYLFRNILIYGSKQSKGEKWGAGIILLLIAAFVVRMHP